MERQQSQRESEVMFLNLPESGVDCPLIQFRDSHICVSLVKVFPLGQSRRSTLKSAERRGEGVPGRAGPGRAGRGPGGAERGGRSCAGAARVPAGGGRGRGGGRDTLRRLPCVLGAGLRFYLRVFPRVFWCFGFGGVFWVLWGLFFPRGTSNFFSPKLPVL